MPRNSNRRQYKTSNQITRIYSIGYTPPAVEGETPYQRRYETDRSPLMRAARYLRKRGTKGRIVKLPYDSGVIVILHASPTTHKEAVAQLKTREGISVSWRASARSGRGRGPMRVKKGDWYEGNVTCDLCGVCISTYGKGHRHERCKRCAKLHPLQQILVGVYGAGVLDD